MRASSFVRQSGMCPPVAPVLAPHAVAAALRAVPDVPGLLHVAGGSARARFRVTAAARAWRAARRHTGRSRVAGAPGCRLPAKPEKCERAKVVEIRRKEPAA